MAFSDKLGGYFFRYIRHILKIYIVWSLVYLPFAVYDAIQRDESFVKYSFIVLRGWLFEGLNWMSWHLWYLLALIIATYIIMVLLNNKLKIEFIFLISVIVTLFGVLLMDIKPFITNLTESHYLILKFYYLIFKHTRNGLFTGLGYVSLGMLLCKYRGYLNRYRNIFLVTIMIFSFMGVCWDFPLSQHLLASIVIVLAIRGNFSLGRYDKYIRSLSLLVYLIHMIFVAIVSIYYPNLMFIDKLIIVSTLSTFISVILLTINKRYHILAMFI